MNQWTQLTLTRRGPAGERGVLGSLLTPLFGGGSDSPAQSPVSWVVLASARRELGVVEASVPAAAMVTSGQLVSPAAAASRAAAVANKPPVISGVTLGSPNASTGVVTATVKASDPERKKLTYKATTSTSMGKVKITRAGVITYTPTAAARHAAARLGADSSVTNATVTVTVTDAKKATATQTVMVPISPRNSAPTATQTVGSPNPTTGVVTGTVSGADADGDPLSYSAPATTAKGSVSISSNTGAFSYTPTAAARLNAGKAGATEADRADTFTVTVTDGYGGSTSVPVKVVVSPTSNRAPVAGTPVVGIPNASTGAVTGSVSATDADGDTLAYSGSTTTSKGSVVVAANGGFTYTPTASARHAAARNGASASDIADTFTVAVSDGNGGTATVPVAVPISASNTAPVAGIPSVGVPNASTGLVAGSVSATDGDGDPLTYTGSTTTSKGTVSVNSNGSFTYTPTAEAQRNAALPGTSAANLSDTFAVTATDGYGGSISVPVKVSVSPLVSYYVTGDVKRDPATGRIALRTIFPPDQTQPGTGTPGYLNWLIAGSDTGALNGFPADVQNWKNLYLVGSAAKTAPFDPAVDYPANTLLRNPQTGAVAIRTIFPEDQGPNLANMAWLVATTSQGGLHVPTSSVQTWDVLFAPTASPNRAPVAGTPVVGTPNTSSGVVTGSVSATDADGDPLTFSGSTTTPKGSVTVLANGGFTYTPTATARNSAAGVNATATDKTDTFTVTVTDGKGGTANVPVSVPISPKAIEPNQPPVITQLVLGAADAATGTVNGFVTASDPENDSFTYTARFSALGGSSSSLSITNKGLLTYSPAPYWRHDAAKATAIGGNTRESVIVTVTDSTGAASSLEFKVLVSPMNAAPVATATAGTPDPKTGWVTVTVKASDADGDKLTFTPVGVSLKGGKVWTSNLGVFTYEPGDNMHAAARDGATAADKTDTVTVTVTDGYGGGTTVPVIVSILPYNRDPVIDAATIGKPDPLTGVATGKVTAYDPDKDSLSYTAIQSPYAGIVVKPDGSFIYTPTDTARALARDSNATLTDNFRITVNDGYGGSNYVRLSSVIAP